ncbi:MAG: carbohydrate binding family 9 domain-containing protein [Flavobacteriaceae bacterium]|nr:carbohydrate binding family 9 domain-containing protein [Flavobacteriaceae bacterium]
MKQHIFPIIAALFLFCQLSFGQEPVSKIPKKSYTTHAIGTERPPVIDGVLDDDAWNIVEWGNDFVEWRPNENTVPTEQTKFKIIYDSKNLYVAIKAYDKHPDSIIRRLSRRDGFVGDRTTIIFDSYHDKRTGFSFTITAAGVKGDEFVSQNGDNWDESWNPIWYTATTVDSEGWNAELKIPLSQLKFGKSDEQIWGLQLMRNYFRTQEHSVWQRIPIDAPGLISEFGELRGLLNIEPQKQLEIQPFSVTQLETYPAEAGNPFRDGSDFKLNGGLDAKIGITNDLTLDLTVNPDFGQVEADPGAITLDAFEIFFEEQRPFFVENKNIFNYDIDNFSADNLFYSRRIGRNPQIDPEVTDNEYVKKPLNTTILGAAKFSGKTRNGWSVGMLESLTSREFAKIDSDGQRRKELVEPLTNYFVGRLQKDFNHRNSYIGGIFTATNRQIEAPVNLLRKAAYTGGMDFMHQWKNRTYYISGNTVFSHVTGSKEAITETQESPVHLFNRVDASHVRVDPNRTSLTGSGGKLEAGKAGSGHWRYAGGITWRSPELELNDIGFLRQADEIRQYARVNFRTLKPKGIFNQIWTGFDMFTTYDFDSNHNRTQYRFQNENSYKNNWWSEFGFIHSPRTYSNSYLQGGPRYRFARENAHWFYFGTANSKKLRYVAGYVYSQGKQDNFSYLRFENRFEYQPTNALQLAFNPEYERNISKTQYVTQVDYNGGVRYIMAGITQQTLSASIRINYTINPNLTIQYYGQPFISKGIYRNFNYVNNPVAKDLYERFHLYTPGQISLDADNGVYRVDENADAVVDYQFDKPDFSFVQFRSNLVLRWEYIPGSEVYVVWSQGVTGDARPEDHLFTSLDKQILDQKKDNIFLIKATYRFML